jgi:hypothetical protein
LLQIEYKRNEMKQKRRNFSLLFLFGLITNFFSVCAHV